MYVCDVLLYIAIYVMGCSFGLVRDMYAKVVATLEQIMSGIFRSRCFGYRIYRVTHTQTHIIYVRARVCFTMMCIRTRNSLS